MVKASGSRAEWKAVDRGWYAILDFRGDRRRRIDDARDMNATHPGAVRIVDEQGSIVHRNVYRPQDLRELAALWAIVGEWPGTEVYIEGRPIKARAVEEFLDCYVEKVISEGRPPSRCSDFVGHPSYIGCRDRHVAIDLRQTDDRIPQRPYWFEFAQARTPSDWRIDPAKIRHFLEPIAPREGCPALRDTGQWIDRLPTRVEVPGAGVWRVVRAPQGPVLAPRDRGRYEAWMRVLLGDDVLSESRPVVGGDDDAGSGISAEATS